MTNKFYKYPSTPHLPWSKSVNVDDIQLTKNIFHGCNVVITEKMDGENTSLYNNHYHARSIDSSHHESQDFVKRFWGTIKHNIPTNMRIVGENVYAEHSIPYKELPDFFLGFSVWEDDICLSWDDTKEWFQLLDITPVPVLYEGIYMDGVIKEINQMMIDNYDTKEGYVIRTTESYSLSSMCNHVAKYVRKNHVQTDEFWRFKPVKPNLLKTSS